MRTFADTSSITLPKTERNWVDRYHEGPDCKTELLCPICKEHYLGWKLRDKCRSCAHPPTFTRHGVRHITHSAVIMQGLVYALPGPSRHPDCIHAFRVLNKKSSMGITGPQGFLDNKGKYVNRKDALRIALKAGQVLDVNNVRAGRLFSEDLW